MFWKKKTPEKDGLPPNQSPTPEILRWGIDHPGIADNLPVVSREDWRLAVDGEVEELGSYTWAEFLGFPQSESVSDFHCVEGWSVLRQRWRGVRFRDISAKSRPKESAKYAFFTCYDGYTTSLPLTEIQRDDVILAHKLNGVDLTQPLGGPMRLVVPAKYAYKSAMWLNRITFLARDQLGFWESGGYSNTADPWRNDRYRHL